MGLNAFIQSETVRNHFEKIGYKISPSVASFVIMFNRYITHEEQIEDWKKLIEISEDECLRESICGKDTIHSLLKSYIEFIDSELKRFQNAESCIYVLIDKDIFWDQLNNSILGIYRDYEECIKALRRFASGNNNRRGNLFVRKQWLDSIEHFQEIHLGDYYMGAESFFDNDITGYEDIEESLCHFGFECKLPFPFKPGDIVAEIQDHIGLIRRNIVFGNYLSQTGDGTCGTIYAKCYMVDTCREEIHAYSPVNVFLLEKYPNHVCEISRFTEEFSKYVRENHSAIDIQRVK